MTGQHAARAHRSANVDDLGLRRALSDRLLPLLVCAMVFLAALAMAGAMQAAALADHWRGGAGVMATVTVPAEAGGDAADSAAAAASAAADKVLAASPGVQSARPLTAAEIAALLKPWLGAEPAQLSLRLPAMFEVRLRQGADDPGLAARLTAAAPGAVLERNGDLLAPLIVLVRSLQACAAAALLVVALVASAVVAVAVQAGLAARRDAIEIIHGLGATDGVIAGRFATRITFTVLGGALLGVLLALPVLVGLARLASPFGDAAGGLLPAPLWAGLAALPLVSGSLGWMTAQGCVRAWLRRMP